MREFGDRMKMFAIPFVCLLCLAFTASLHAQSKRIISGKGVYLFGPSLAEADSVPTDESKALSDFANYSNQIAIFARSNGLSCGYVSARTVEIRFGSMRKFTVCRDSIEFGTIFTDGKKKPLLFQYVVTDAELKEKAKEYFELK